MSRVIISNGLVMVRCGKCNTYKPSSQFHEAKITPKNPSGFQGYCKECNKIVTNNRLRQRIKTGEARQDYKETYKTRRWTKLLNQYGVTKEQYEELAAYQHHICAICQKPETRMYKDVLCKLVVDHDHKTGEIRGLLCYNCNLGLGNFKDDPASLQRAINYLENKES